MLHRLDLPAEAAHLTWVLELQERLLRQLCHPHTVGKAVTEDWVKTLWHDAPAEWVRTFCRRTVDGIRCLDAMKTIANATDEDKQNLLAAFLNDVRPEIGFHNATATFRLHGCSRFLDDTDLVEAVESLFQRFYKPQFDPANGFPAPHLAADELFIRSAYVAAVIESNDLGVCPYCDGTLDKKRAKLDHFYPKDSPQSRPHTGYPFLAIAPFNLVPACTDCNSLQIKGAERPLCSGDTQEVLKWFHPYFRTAEGSFRVEFRPPRNNDEPRQVCLTSDDPLTSQRLEKLDGLLKLCDYWGRRLKYQIDEKIRILRMKRRKGITISDEELREEFNRWADEAVAARRSGEFSYLKEAMCRAVETGDAQMWPEFREVANE